MEKEKILFEEKEKEENIWRGTKYLLRRIKKWERKEGKYLKKKNHLLGEKGGKHQELIGTR